MELQPDYPRYLYSVYSRAHGIHTTFDPDEEARHVMDPQATRDQYFFNPGIAAGFLASLYKATGEHDWLNLAREYMRQAEDAGDYFYRSLRAGKVGWAASVLYTLTGESKYRDIAVRVGENLVATQCENGAWDSINGSQYIIDCTAEMVVWLDEIHQAVGRRVAA
jgi:rhamnogalacturonyl hydrolase YesR